MAFALMGCPRIEGGGPAKPMGYKPTCRRRACTSCVWDGTNDVSHVKWRRYWRTPKTSSQ
eukprot:1463760-Pyramimonas_sp.AAC.1